MSQHIPGRAVKGILEPLVTEPQTEAEQAEYEAALDSLAGVLNETFSDSTWGLEVGIRAALDKRRRSADPCRIRSRRATGASGAAAPGVTR